MTAVAQPAIVTYDAHRKTNHSQANFMARSTPWVLRLMRVAPPGAAPKRDARNFGLLDARNPMGAANRRDERRDVKRAG